MARKTLHPQPELQIKQFGSAEEIHRAISKLNRRIEDVKQLNPNEIHWNDQRVHNVESSIRNTILEIYGPNSPEYRDNQAHTIGPTVFSAYLDDVYYQKTFVAALPKSIALLEGLIISLQEKLEDFESDTPARAYDTFQGLHFHPRIAEVSSRLFKDGHYSEAIFEASKALVHLVQERSGSRLDGTSLMEKVFSKNKPILAFNKLETKTDFDEQEGMMYLYKGFVLGIRNPKAHSNITNKPNEHRTLEYLAFISLLAERLNEAVLLTENR